MSAPSDEHANHYNSNSNEQGSEEKPCRSCTDFKTWMKLKGKSVEVTVDILEYYKQNQIL